MRPPLPPLLPPPPPPLRQVDGAEGGTGAAPPEFSNSVGMPMAEGLTLVNAILRGAGLRDQVGGRPSRERTRDRCACVCMGGSCFASFFPSCRALCASWAPCRRPPRAVSGARVQGAAYGCPQTRVCTIRHYFLRWPRTRTLLYFLQSNKVLVREQVKIIAAGKVLTGFSIVRTLALGADVTNSARAMLFALGCIQSLKCNTNTCPTGITTQDPRLMAGLVVPDKAARVASYHAKTVHAALEITGALGYESAGQITARDVNRRVESHGLKTFEEIYPWVATAPGSLVDGSAHPNLQAVWDNKGAHSHTMWENL